MKTTPPPHLSGRPLHLAPSYLIFPSLFFFLNFLRYHHLITLFHIPRLTCFTFHSMFAFPLSSTIYSRLSMFFPTFSECFFVDEYLHHGGPVPGEWGWGQGVRLR